MFPRWWRRRGKALTAATLTTSSWLCSAFENTHTRHVSHTPPCKKASSDTQSAWTSGAGKKDVFKWLLKQSFRFSLKEKEAHRNTHSSRNRVSAPRLAARKGSLKSYRLRQTCSHTPKEETTEHTHVVGACHHSGCSLKKKEDYDYNKGCVSGLISIFKLNTNKYGKYINFYFDNKLNQKHLVFLYLDPYLSGKV